MFNNRDYKEYFTEILRMEEMMIDRAATVEKEFKGDTESLAQIKHWMMDEKKHYGLAQEMIKIIK